MIRLTIVCGYRQASSSSIGVTTKRRCWSRSPVLKSVVKDAASGDGQCGLIPCHCLHLFVLNKRDTVDGHGKSDLYIQ